MRSSPIPPSPSPIPLSPSAEQRATHIIYNIFLALQQKQMEEVLRLKGELPNLPHGGELKTLIQIIKNTDNRRDLYCVIKKYIDTRHH